MNQQNKIIIFLTAIFLLGSIWLFYASGKILDSNQNKNWWSVYFSNPKLNDLDFTIENHSSSNNFHWQLLVNEQKLDAGDSEIIKGQKIEVAPKIETSDIAGKKIIIQVSSENDSKEIYKNF